MFGNAGGTAVTAKAVPIQIADASMKGVDSASRYKALHVGENTEYPKLSSVPPRPRNPTSARARRARAAIREGLVTDSENARRIDPARRPPKAPVIGRTPDKMSPDAARSNERLPARARGTAENAPMRLAGGDPSELLKSKRKQKRPKERDQARVVGPAPAARLPSSLSDGVFTTVQIATIYFPKGSSRLSDEDRAIMQQVADIVQSRAGTVRVIGHSSVGQPTEDDARRQRLNFRVSMARANMVASELLRLGVPGNKLQVIAEGARKPIYAESQPTGAAGNRRTEIYMNYQKGY